MCPLGKQNRRPNRMPYVPPHLRPGYVKPPSPKKVDYTGRVHWPTNVNSHRQNNIVQPSALHAPATAETLGLRGSKKPAMKLVMPITPNLSPVARPTSVIDEYPSKFRTAVIQHLKHSVKREPSKKKKSRTRSKRHKPSKKTRRR